MSVVYIGRNDFDNNWPISINFRSNGCQTLRVCILSTMAIPHNFPVAATWQSPRISTAAPVIFQIIDRIAGGAVEVCNVQSASDETANITSNIYNFCVELIPVTRTVGRERKRFTRITSARGHLLKLPLEAAQ